MLHCPFLEIRLPLCLLACTLLTSLSDAFGGSGVTCIYVATDGNDASPGSHKQPFATLTRARDAVRALKAKKLTRPVEVVIRAGVYYLTKPLVLTRQDGGTERWPITWRAAKGERVVICGGRRITGWKERSDGLWASDAPHAAGRRRFRELFVGNQRRTPARSPNEGYFRVLSRGAPFRDTKTGDEKDSSRFAFRFRRGDIKPWTDLNEINVVVFRNWETAMLRLASVDLGSQTVVFTGPMNWPFRREERYYVENVLEGLDAPGEWYLDRPKGLLYYRPMPGENMSRAEVVAPVLTQLLRLKGEPDRGRFVQHVRFEGLSFEYTDYRLEPGGHSDHQAAVSVPAVIQARGARSCTFTRCEIAHAGVYGIWLKRGCTHNRIVQCEIHDLGAGGVRIGEPDVPQTKEAQTGYNIVSNNFIHDLGRVYYGAVGVWVGQSSDNVISHNEICDINYTGISIGWRWDYGPSACQRNLVEYNHVHHIGRGVLSDMGGIYTLGISTGTKIRHNLIHHVWDAGEGGASGIYPDQGSSGLVIENNLVYLTTAGGFTLHFGRETLIRNNIFAFGRDQQFDRGKSEDHVAYSFERNIVYYKQGDLVRAPGTLNLECDYNLYWRTGGKAVRFAHGLSFDQWKAKGLDRRSMIADPLFMDAEHFDFRLKPNSPAFKLGFEPIDLSKVGLYGAADWTDKPKRIERATGGIPPKPLPSPLFVDDGFEYTPVGMRAYWAGTAGENDGARIRVTDKRAASGNKCLEFVDAPGLQYSWYPYIAYAPRIRGGTVRLQFHMRFCPDSVVWHEWRDDAHPFHVGPGLRVDAQGRLIVAGKTLLRLPANQWIRFAITCAMGAQARGT